MGNLLIKILRSLSDLDIKLPKKYLDNLEMIVSFNFNSTDLSLMLRDYSGQIKAALSYMTYGTLGVNLIM